MRERGVLLSESHVRVEHHVNYAAPIAVILRSHWLDTACNSANFVNATSCTAKLKFAIPTLFGN